MAVWITGDIHGNPQRFSTDIFPEQKEMTKDDVVIILGDFGLVWDYSGENKTEKYWLDWLEINHSRHYLLMEIMIILIDLIIAQ